MFRKSKISQMSNQINKIIGKRPCYIFCCNRQHVMLNFYDILSFMNYEFKEQKVASLTKKGYMRGP